jgi:hypothetical protein
MSEIIEKLEKLADKNKWDKNSSGYWVYSEACPFVIAQQTLDLLKQQPEGEWTKEFRRVLDEVVVAFATTDERIIEESVQAAVNYGRDACDRLDTSEAMKDELLKGCEKFKQYYINIAGNGDILWSNRYGDIEAAIKKGKG